MAQFRAHFTSHISSVWHEHRQRHRMAAQVHRVTICREPAVQGLAMNVQLQTATSATLRIGRSPRVKSWAKGKCLIGSLQLLIAERRIVGYHAVRDGRAVAQHAAQLRVLPWCIYREICVNMLDEFQVA